MPSGEPGEAGRCGTPVGIVLRPIGVPLPLGLAALAVGSFLISAQELGWVGASHQLEIGLILLGFVFPLQLLASIFGFLSRDPVAGTATALTSGAWLVVGIDRIVPGAESDVLGFALIAVAASLLVPISVSWFSNVAVFLVLFATDVRFFLSSAYALSDAQFVQAAAGVAGLAVTLLSLYTAMALELEEVDQGPRPPLLRRGSSWRILEGRFAEQVEGIEREPGVRRHL